MKIRFAAILALALAACATAPQPKMTWAEAVGADPAAERPMLASAGSRLPGVLPRFVLRSSISSPGGVATGLNGPATCPFTVKDASGNIELQANCSFGGISLFGSAGNSGALTYNPTYGELTWVGQFGGGIRASYFSGGAGPGTLKSLVADSASAVSTVLDTNGAFATAGAKIVSVRNAGTEKAYIDKDGFISSGAKPVPSVINATVAQGIEASTQALTAGAATVTFPTAFSAVPVCICTDQTAAAAVKCAPTATTLPIAGTSTDVIAWNCVGAR